MNQILVVAAVLFAAVALGLAVRAWYGRFRLRRRWARARKIERQASLLLADLGYQVLDSQVETTYTLLVDGEPSTVKLRADYLVSRAGRRFVAEVKSGQAAPRLDTAATRRQLLEYWAVFQVDGILLVDGEARQVYEVTFPTRHRGPRLGALYGFVVGLAVAMAFAFWFLFSNPATSFRSGAPHTPTRVDTIGAGGGRAPESAKHR
jgi:hypothetical protein